MSPDKAPVLVVDECGADFNTTMVVLRQQVNCGSSVSSDCPINWTQVEQLSTELLGKGIKHFQVVSYWGIARLHNQGFSAIAETAERLTHLVEENWESALPPVRRLRGRMSAIEWWIEGSVKWIKQSVVDSLTVALQDQAISAVSRFDRVLTARCETIPVFYPLLNALKQLEPALQPDPDMVASLMGSQAVTVLPEPWSAPAASIIAAIPIVDLPKEQGTADNKGTDNLPNDQLEKSDKIEEIDTSMGSKEADGEITDSESGTLAVVLPSTLCSSESSSKPTPHSGLQTTAVIALSAVQQIVNQVTECVQGGNLTQAVRLLQQGQKSSLGADRLQLTCELAHLLHRAGYTELATVQMQQALALVTQHQLTTWDPELAQQALESAYDFFSTISNYQEAAAVLKSLSLLDAARVIDKLSTSLERQ